MYTHLLHVLVTSILKTKNNIIPHGTSALWHNSEQRVTTHKTHGAGHNAATTIHTTMPETTMRTQQCRDNSDVDKAWEAVATLA